MSDHLGTGVRIEESVANDLAHDIVGAPVVGFRPAWFALEGLGAALTEGMENLEIARLGVSGLFGGLGRAKAETMPFEEHDDFANDFIIAGQFD